MRMDDGEQIAYGDIQPRTQDIDVLKTAMINRLANTDAFFKHQVRGEPDLQTEEKCAIANELLERNAGLFLERFSTYLSLEDIECFTDTKDDYLVSFYINKIRECCGGKNKNIIKNRRYQALQDMMGEGDYFSDARMQNRDPLLYEQMVGQFETEEEKQAKDIDKTDLRLSSILMKYMDKQEVKYRYEQMKEREEEQEEEEEESDDEEDDDEDGVRNINPKRDDDDKTAEDCQNDQERADMRHEFLRIMQERFLSGEDSQFDYSQVDGNAQYDSLAILNRDAEEKYFDGDDSNST